MTDANTTPRSAEEIAAWLRQHLAPLLRCAPEDIDPRARFDRFGLDSATAVRVTLDLEDWLGKSVDPGMLSDYPTIEQMAAALVQYDDASGTASIGGRPTDDGSQ